MRFCKSERQIHQPDYNPPCNVYLPTHKLASNKILTGSLAAPALTTENTFGYAQRFEKDKLDIPGPGTYFQQRKPNGTLQTKATTIKTKIIKSSLANNPSTPSIPYSYYGQEADEEENNYVKQLLLSQNVAQSCKIIKRKDPSFSFSKSQRNMLSSQAKKKKKTNQINELIQLQNRILNENESLNRQQKKTSILWQQKIKRANQRRLQVIQTIDPQFIPSLELIDLIKKKKNKPTPGPTDYYKFDQPHQQFQLVQNPKGVSFTSVKRFNPDKATILGPGLYNPNIIKNSQQFSFSKSSRNSLEKRDDSNFRFYINPETKNEEITNANKQNFAFSSGATRFPQVVHEGEPALTLQQEIKRQSNTKLDKMIKVRQRMHNRQGLESQKDEGLLGISTMASTID